MSSQTKPAFITETEGWEQARNHPVLIWMEEYTHDFDARKVFSSPYTDWHTVDYEMRHYNGTVYPKGEGSFEGLKEMYAPFVKTCHYPRWVVIWETDNGW